MVYAIGGTAKMHALDKETGKLVWSSDFFEEFGALSDIRGRSPSPIEYAGKIIMVVGGAAGLVMAFDPKTGDIAWKSPPGDISHATPIVANVHGEDQLIFTTEQFVIGLAAKTGEARWEFPHPSRERVSIPNVLWLDDTYVFASGINLNPKQLLKITREGDDFTAEEVWTQTNEIKTYQTPGLRFGEYVLHGLGDDLLLLQVEDRRNGLAPARLSARLSTTSAGQDDPSRRRRPDEPGEPVRGRRGSDLSVPAF